MKNDKQNDILNAYLIKSIPIPPKGYKIYWDDGLGFRITARGKKSFVFQYVFEGRQRSYTIGPYPAFNLSAARERKEKLQVMVKDGIDPLVEKQKRFQNPTVKELSQEFKDEYLPKYCRSGTEKEYKRLLEQLIIPVIGNLKCMNINPNDVRTMHSKLSSTPYQANRCLAVTRKMFNFGIEKGYLPKNPAISIKKYAESKRERWLYKAELQQLITMLNKHPNKRAARAVLLLIYTGSRKSEVLGASWDMFDLDEGLWTKPSHHTKQKKLHHIPLNPAAIQILKDIRQEQDAKVEEAEFVFPGDVNGQPLCEIKRFWDDIRKQAKIPDVRIHDLRHTYASHLVSNQVPLQIVGQLLGHTEMQTTMRYAHLADSVLKEATNMFELVINQRPDE